MKEPARGPGAAAEDIHDDLAAVKERVYDALGLICLSLREEAQNAEYGAYRFALNSREVRFRTARITPTKIGQFVTLWQRGEEGTTQPYDAADPAELFVICTRQGGCFGQFVFPKEVLRQRDIVSTEGRGGKRGIRVYPPWDEPANAQARKTQSWQSAYFLHIPLEKEPVDRERALLLYGLQKQLTP